MTRPTLASLVAAGSMDAELAALLWLLGEGGVPFIVAGSARLKERAAVAEAVLGVDPSRPWSLIDVDDGIPTLERLTAHLRGGAGVALTLAASDLRDVLERLSEPPRGLPEDAVRRLGAVLIVDPNARGVRLTASHYLRPTERDAEGHVQRRPPAVLATWNEATDDFEHFAWGVMPELADRVDRAQGDLEERQRDRAAFLGRAAQDATSALEQGTSVATYLATEPPRVPAPPRERAKPTPFHGGLTDPHVH